MTSLHERDDVSEDESSHARSSSDETDEDKCSEWEQLTAEVNIGRIRTARYKGRSKLQQKLLIYVLITTLP